MKISKNSWHYKICSDTMKSKIYHNEPVTLCGYFWDVVFMMFCILFSVIIFGSILYFIGGFWVSLISNWLFGHLLFSVNLMKIGVITNVIVALYFLLLMMGSVSINNHSKKEPSLFGQYLKANKEKFCPFIEIE